MTRIIFLAIGWLGIGLGAIGIIMPLFPTAPFLLVSLWAFSRSSPEMAEKIRNHPLAGSFIRDWQDHGVVPTKAKYTAVIMMSCMMAYIHFFAGVPAWAEYTAAAVLLGVGIFIVTRPGAAPDSEGFNRRQP